MSSLDKFDKIAGTFTESFFLRGSIHRLKKGVNENDETEKYNLLFEQIVLFWLRSFLIK